MERYKGVEIFNVEDFTVKTVKGVELVKGMSFTIEEGEILSVVGLSGCGKSILCKGILGLLSKREFDVSGVIKFKDDVLDKSRRNRLSHVRGKDICMIMQNPLTAFNPLIKIGDQIIETLKLHTNCSKATGNEMIKKSLSEVKLDDVDLILNSYPHTLSGGMLQRIMIALTLTLKPSLIVADEITSAIDAATKKSILEEILRIKANGIAVLFVSHDIKEINYVSDRIMVMKSGRIINEGRRESIMNEKTCEHTKCLLNSKLVR